MAHAIDLSSACSALLFTLSGVLPPAVSGHFVSLAWGWLLCLGRPTVSNLGRVMPEKFERHWTCAHRFFSRYRWSMDDLFRVLVCELIDPFLPADQLWLVAADDTTAHKFGKHVAFAGKFRDAVRSTSSQTAFHWAHNWVVLCLLVPISLRLYKKEVDCSCPNQFRTRHQLVAEMLQLLHEWLPHREIQLVADGAYAAKELASSLPSGVPLISRLRSDSSRPSPSWPTSRRTDSWTLIPHRPTNPSRYLPSHVCLRLFDLANGRNEFRPPCAFPLTVRKSCAHWKPSWPQRVSVLKSTLIVVVVLLLTGRL